MDPVETKSHQSPQEEFRSGSLRPIKAASDGKPFVSELEFGCFRVFEEQDNLKQVEPWQL